MGHAIDPNVLLRYLAGDCTPAERAAMDAWIAADPRHAEEVTLHREIVDRIRLNYGEYGDPQPTIRQLEARIAREQADPVARRRVSVPRGVGARWPRMIAGGVAAACAFVLGFGLWYSYRTPSSAASRAYVTAAGQRETVDLRDGTQAILAPGSRLQLGSGYGVSNRNAVLDGEAYFIVRHDPWHPFAVRTRGITIRDVGTRFDVRAYADDDRTRVAVADGVVAVGNATLRAGDVLTATSTGRVTLQHDVEITTLTGWMQGTFVFHDTPLRDAVRDISRAYGVSITVADSTLLDRRITVTLADKSLDVALTVVSSVVGARFERDAQGVVIRKRTTASAAPDHATPLSLTARTGDVQP